MRGFDAGQPILHISTEASDLLAAVLERAAWPTGQRDSSPLPVIAFTDEQSRKDLVDLVPNAQGRPRHPAGGSTGPPVTDDHPHR